jgi:hypothetical protein
MNDLAAIPDCVSDFVTLGWVKKHLLYPQSAQALANAVVDAVDGIHANMDVLCQLLDVAADGDDFANLQHSARLFNRAVQLRGRPSFDALSGSLYYSDIPNSPKLDHVFFTVAAIA